MKISNFGYKAYPERLICLVLYYSTFKARYRRLKVAPQHHLVIRLTKRPNDVHFVFEQILIISHFLYAHRGQKREMLISEKFHCCLRIVYIHDHDNSAFQCVSNRCKGICQFCDICLFSVF